MRIVAFMLGAIGFLSMGSQQCFTPVEPTPTQLIHCSELLSFLKKQFPEVNFPGVTQEWYCLLHPQDYQIVTEILQVSTRHIWVLLGEVKKWHPGLAVGWAFDASAQKDLLIVISGLPDDLRVMLYDPEVGWTNLRGRRIFLVRI